MDAVEERDPAHGAEITRSNLRVMAEVFGALEGYRGEHALCSAPIFDVKLEALHSSRRIMDERTFRIKVSSGAFPSVDRDEWMSVLELAQKHDLSAVLDNGAMLLS